MSKGRPLSFCLKLPGPNSDDPAQKKLTWFSYDLYRGHRSRKSELLYAKTKQDSDDLAYYKSFAAEAPYHIQGFDLEWPSFPTNANTHFRLQDRVAPHRHRHRVQQRPVLHLGTESGRTPARTRRYWGAARQDVLVRDDGEAGSS